MSETLQDYRKYLQPDVVARLANMELVARLVVEGFITGLHKSPWPTRIPRAIGRSNAGPAFFTSAGARLISVFVLGYL